MTPVAAARAGRSARNEIVVGPRSRGIGRVGEAAYPAIVALSVVGILLLRLPLTSAAFLQEEVVGFYAQPDVIAPWNGFLHVIPRLAFLASQAVPYQFAPLIPMAAMVAVIALVAAFVAGDGFAAVIPDPATRRLAAVGLALLPIGTLYTTVLNVQWFLTLYLVALLFVGITRKDRALAAIVGLSAPAVVLLAPLFLRRDRWLAGVLGGCAALQLVTYVTSPRGPSSIDASLVTDTAVRLGTAPLGDLAVPLSAAIAVLVGIAAWRARDRLPWPFLAISAGIALVGFSSIAPEYRLLTTHGARYVALMAWCLLVLALDRRALVIGLLFVAGIAASFRIAPNEPGYSTPGPTPIGVTDTGTWLYR